MNRRPRLRLMSEQVSDTDLVRPNIFIHLGSRPLSRKFRPRRPKGQRTKTRPGRLGAPVHKADFSAPTGSGGCGSRCEASGHCKFGVLLRGWKGAQIITVAISGAGGKERRQKLKLQVSNRRRWLAGGHTTVAMRLASRWGCPGLVVMTLTGSLTRHTIPSPTLPIFGGARHLQLFFPACPGSQCQVITGCACTNLILGSWPAAVICRPWIV
ncbi:hypothetical protein B0H66DRAFT_351188 [Apodospora peruviana]|uniref:Uncharacterized protein n=1 Tax=Apodospora peruviana TaxID=516989 RepID=A0AAE0HVL4_9PEZI|nr:hypothetical protein B0H66DRAFT_351188 [Apodospora peruviana]